MFCACTAYEQTECANCTSEWYLVVVGETSIILCLHMYLQICQAEVRNPSNTFTIANGSEQIIIDPSGQTYLRYTGPGQDGSGPRYVKYTRSYIILYP